MRFYTILMIIGGLLLTLLLAQEMPHQVMTRSCTECHVEEQWSKIIFNHDVTLFPLENRHKLNSCTDCHNIKNFTIVNSSCESCHPDVHQEKLGKICDQCHVTVSWTILDPLTAHANTTFPLIGAHARLDCKVCHISESANEFSMPQSECEACHLNDFLQAENPVHSDLGFSHNCQECHTLLFWKGADFKQHDSFFPIFSGEHSGKWDTCLTCHYEAGNYNIFSCYLNCHKHNKSSMDSRHQEVNGYVYDSQECYRCHPRG